MTVRYVLRTILALSILVTILTGCGRTSGEPSGGPAIVYVAVPLSGFQANGGQTVLGGVRLAAEQINRSGGLLNHEVIVRPLDDESDSEVAVARISEIEQAIEQGEQVVAVIGHLNSGQTLAAMEQYKDLSLVVVTPTASEESLTQRGYENFFRVNANDRVQAAVDAAFLINELGARNIAVLHNDTEYGRGLAASLVNELQQRGATIAVNLEVEEGQAIYTEEIARIQEAAPDAIFYAGYEIEAPYLRTALVEAGIGIPMLASDGAFLAATIDEARGTAEGMYVSAFAPSPRNVADEQWFEAYQAVEYRNPDTYSVNGYVAMQVIAAGAQEADSLEAESLADSIRTNTMDTLLDGLQFDENGDLEDPEIWIYQVEDGEFRQVQ